MLGSRVVALLNQGNAATDAVAIPSAVPDGAVAADFKLAIPAKHGILQGG